MTKVAKVKKRKRRRRRSRRNSRDGPGNCHSRMHRSESARQTGFALHDQAEQKESAHAEPAREKEIQSVFAEAHASSGNQIIANATQDRQTPFRISPRQSRHAPAPDRHRHRSDRLQKSRSFEKIRDRERQDSSPPRHRHAGASPSQNHARDQAQPLRAADEITVSTTADYADVRDHRLAAFSARTAERTSETWIPGSRLHTHLRRDPIIVLWSHADTFRL